MNEWRSRYPVLVADAQAMGAIGAIRSLGRGGYMVHACSSQADALGLRSNYASAAVVCPDYDASDFLPWLKQYIQRHNLRAIVPSEGLLLAVRKEFPEFARLFHFPQPEQIVYAGLSKSDQLNSLLQSPNKEMVANHLPPILLVEHPQFVPDQAELERLGAPLYIKVDACWGQVGESSAVYRASSAREASELLAKLASRFHKALIQGHVAGQGVGVFFLSWKGQLLAEFMHLRLHEVPHTGGVSSFRKSWWHAGIRDDALAKLRQIGWEGVAMMEYRWDRASDQFWFLEMNARFWGSLHLALYAGVDFPLLLLDAFHGHLPAPVREFPRGVRCRHTFPKEVEYVWSRLKDRSLPLSSQIWSGVEFFLLCLDPRVYSDLLFPGDRKLYWEAFKRFLKSFLR